MHLTVEVRRQKDSLRSMQSKATTAATNPPQFPWHRACTHARTDTHTPESATTTASPPHSRPLQRKHFAKAPPKRYQDERLNCHTHHPRHTACHHLRDPKHCHSPNSVSWTMVDCARPRLHRPKHAFAPRSHKNQTSQGLDPNLYT